MILRAMSTEDKEVYMEMTLLDLEEKYGRTANGRRESFNHPCYIVTTTSAVEGFCARQFLQRLQKSQKGRANPVKAV